MRKNRKVSQRHHAKTLGKENEEYFRSKSTKGKYKDEGKQVVETGVGSKKSRKSSRVKSAQTSLLTGGGKKILEQRRPAKLTGERVRPVGTTVISATARTKENKKNQKLNNRLKSKRKSAQELKEPQKLKKLQKLQELKKLQVLKKQAEKKENYEGGLEHLIDYASQIKAGFKSESAKQIFLKNEALLLKAVNHILALQSGEFRLSEDDIKNILSSLNTGSKLENWVSTSLQQSSKKSLIASIFQLIAIANPQPGAVSSNLPLLSAKGEATSEPPGVHLTLPSPKKEAKPKKIKLPAKQTKPDSVKIKKQLECFYSIIKQYKESLTKKGQQRFNFHLGLILKTHEEKMQDSAKIFFAGRMIPYCREVIEGFTSAIKQRDDQLSSQDKKAQFKTIELLTWCYQNTKGKEDLIRGSIYNEFIGLSEFKPRAEVVHKKSIKKSLLKFAKQLGSNKIKEDKLLFTFLRAINKACDVVLTESEIINLQLGENPEDPQFHENHKENRILTSFLNDITQTLSQGEQGQLDGNARRIINNHYPEYRRGKSLCAYYINGDSNALEGKIISVGTESKDAYLRALQSPLKIESGDEGKTFYARRGKIANLFYQLLSETESKSAFYKPLSELYRALQLKDNYNTVKAIQALVPYCTAEVKANENNAQQLKKELILTACVHGCLAAPMINSFFLELKTSSSGNPRLEESKLFKQLETFFTTSRPLEPSFFGGRKSQSKPTQEEMSLQIVCLKAVLDWKKLNPYSRLPVIWINGSGNSNLTEGRVQRLIKKLESELNSNCSPHHLRI